MRLFEAILDANHRAVAGDPNAGLNRSEFSQSLPVVVLTCIDPRLNPLLPNVLGIHEEDFIWLRNAGNIIFDPMSSMTRTLTLACAIKGGKEIAVIGHTDCRVRKTSMLELIDKFKELGVERNSLPEDLNSFFGLFASERQNVIKGAEIIRSSPLIGSKVPVHGLLIDVETGKLEWIVNGYESLKSSPQKNESVFSQTFEAIGSIQKLEKSLETKVGETITAAKEELAEVAKEVVETLPPPIPPKAIPPIAYSGYVPRPKDSNKKKI